MYPTIIHMIMDQINIGREHVFFKGCWKGFGSIVTAYQDILMTLRIIFRNELVNFFGLISRRLRLVVAYILTKWNKLEKPEFNHLPDCTYYLHGVCISYLFNRYIADNSHCLPACNSFSFHVESLQVSPVPREPLPWGRFRLFNVSQLVTKCSV